jgi:hypothetical protein
MGDWRGLLYGYRSGTGQYLDTGIELITLINKYQTGIRQTNKSHIIALLASASEK